jgi:hypothetical protein
MIAVNPYPASPGDRIWPRPLTGGGPSTRRRCRLRHTRVPRKHKTSPAEKQSPAGSRTRTSRVGPPLVELVHRLDTVAVPRSRSSDEGVGFSLASSVLSGCLTPRHKHQWRLAERRNPRKGQRLAAYGSHGPAILHNRRGDDMSREGSSAPSLSHSAGYQRHPARVCCRRSAQSRSHHSVRGSARTAALAIRVH